MLEPFVDIVARDSQRLECRSWDRTEDPRNGLGHVGVEWSANNTQMLQTGSTENILTPDKTLT